MKKIITLSVLIFLSLEALSQPITFSGKIFLQGAYNAATGQMNNTLNSLGILQAKATEQPYNIAAFNYTGTETVGADFFAAHSDIVDWILIELRHAVDETLVISSRAAFVKKDGVIIDTDGAIGVKYNSVPRGNYKVAVRHRNHLSILSATPIAFINGSGSYDFSTTDSKSFQDQSYTSTIQIGDVLAMRAGNANSNNNIKYNGPANDQNQILNVRLGGSISNILNNVYAPEDLNMNGNIKWNGPSNDQNFLLNTALGGSLSNLLLEQLPAGKARTKIIRGQVNLPSETIVNLTDLTVLSKLDSSAVNSTGSFNLMIADPSAEVQLLVKNKTGHVIMIGYYVGDNKNYTISAESTGISLLLMYPFLKPLSGPQKENLIKLYKSQPEFPTLITDVTSVIKSDGDIFSATNTAIINTIDILINKDFNKDRLQLRNLETSPGAVDFKFENNKITLNNNQTYSFVGGIYRIKDNLNLMPFILAGSLLKNSAFIQYARPSDYQLNPEDLKSIRTFDLKVLGLNPGKYEIRLKSGLELDGSDEDRLALGENTYELTMSILDNISPDIKFLKDNNCKNAIISNLSSNIKTKYSINKNTNLDVDVIRPFFQENYQTLVECNPAGPSYFDQFSKYLFKVLNLVKTASSLSNFPLWVTGSKKEEGCYFVYADNTLTSCFKIKAKKTDEKDYTGDTIQLEIKATGDKRFYPYSEDPVKDVKFNWISMKGGGELQDKDDNKGLILTGSTDDGGRASIKWILPCEEIQNEASILFPFTTYEVPKDLFVIKSYNPDPVFTISDNSKTGAVGAELEKKLGITAMDAVDNSGMLISRFNINWTLPDGGKIEPDVTLLNTATYTWTLGPKVGEQVATANISSKVCNWAIKNNIIPFKVTAGIDTVTTLINHGNWGTTEGQWGDVVLGTPLINEQRTCGNSSYQHFYKTDSIVISFQQHGKGFVKEYGFYRSSTGGANCTVIETSESEEYGILWEYIPSLKRIRCNWIDDNDEGFTIDLISFSSTTMHVKGYEWYNDNNGNLVMEGNIEFKFK